MTKREEPVWHVVHTLSRSEWRAHQGLRRQGFDTLYLHYLGTVDHARRKIGVLKPLFPRYLFVGVTSDQGLYDVNTTPGVATVLFGVDGPAPVPAEQIEILRQRADQDGRVDMPKAKPAAPIFELGHEVRVIAGPLRGFDAIIELDNGGEVRVRLAAFGGAITAVIPAEALEPLHPQGANRPKSTPCNANSLAK